ncbi:hypothetical protein M405DRAFT_863633 [Rhizopogon salebrosus TDB-379]|nr:hypothetical protein M405DRAFT_863633 [Rhizopogon salebrosus TDB-379]
MDLVTADESPRRPSLARDRPSRPPLPNGPRMRSRQKNPLDTNTPPGSSIESGSPVGSVMTSPIFTSPFLRPGSPGFLDETNSFSLDASVPQRVPPYGTSSHARTTSDVGVQASPDLSSPPAAGPPPAEKPKLTLKPKPSIATFLAPPSLVPPPAVSFESAPIPWKGLPYEAAQWTFTSSELQEIVSRAIRLSAKESFIRLLSLQALDTDVVKEAERLEEERSAAQVKWRFETNRRTMLMQALNASASILASSGDGDKDNVLGNLISQAAASIASCDSIFASVLQMSDQQSQISIVQHRHWASALGIALRKLNKAVERQGEEMKRALMRIQTLEDELEEAWREAEGMAAEIDEMESDGEEVDDIDDSETLGGLTINTDLGQVMGVTSKAVLSKATLITQVHHIASDAKSVKSVKSSRSRRSNKDGPSRASRLSAAKTRSRTVSNASLRLPKALRTPTSSQTSPEEPPPMPALPDNLQCYSFLDMENSGTEYARPPRKQLPDRAPEPTVSLPDPPHTAGLPRTTIPSIWIDTDSPGVRLNGVDRSHSMQIFPTLRHGRRSELVMSLSQSDPGDSPVDNVAPAFGILDAVGADRPPITDRPPPVIDRPASAVDRLVSGAMDRPRSSNLDRRSSGSYKFLPLLSERSSGIPAAVFSGGRYYTPSGLPSYRSTETISEGGTPPRVGTPSTG